MTLIAIDAFVEHGDALVIVQCDCGERLSIYDTLDPESAVDQAYAIHPCPRCIVCDEPASLSALLDTDPNAIPVHLSCYLDDRQGTREAIIRHLEAQEVVA